MRFPDFSAPHVTDFSKKAPSFFDHSRFIRDVCAPVTPVAAQPVRALSIFAQSSLLKRRPANARNTNPGTRTPVNTGPEVIRVPDNPVVYKYSNQYIFRNSHRQSDDVYINLLYLHQ